MAVQSTSLAAYRKIAESLNRNRGKVFAAIYSSPEPISDYQIAQALKWQHHCVTPRRGELDKMGFIEVAFVAAGPPYQNEVAYWRINSECLADGWKPKPLPRRKKLCHRPVSVHEASMVLVEHRRRLRAQRKKEVFPLFGHAV